jgi:hypothetical protein
MNNESQQQEFQQPPAQPTGASSAVKAALCAVIPGVGAVYNREYVKAVVHFSIFAGLVIIAEDVGVFVLASIAFWVYTILDAYRSAEAIAKQGGVAAMAEGNDQINLPLWGGILLLMGILFLLDNLGAIDIRSAFQFWPLILVALGAYLIFSHFRPSENGGAQPKNRKVETSPPPRAHPAAQVPEPPAAEPARVAESNEQES